MNRIEREKATIRQMIALYCRCKEKNHTLCQPCNDLLGYACRRLDACRYGQQKGNCQRCPTHCYAAAYRAKIREVMRYSGPRMLLRHPVAVLSHLIHSLFRCTARQGVVTRTTGRGDHFRPPPSTKPRLRPKNE